MTDRPGFLTIHKGTGILAPLVCVLCDEVGRKLPELVDHERPVYAYRHLGEDGHRIELTTVEGIAQRFVAELLEARPQGPCILAGYSFGGVVSFEMARQLRAMGREVPLNILIDTYAPSLHPAAMRHGHHFLTTLKDHVRHALVEQRLSHGKLLKGRLNHHHIIDTYSKAISRYTAQPSPGPMLVIKAAKGWGPPDLGWHALAQGGLVLQALPCDHVDIAKGAHAEELLAIIRSGLMLAGC